MQINIIGRKGLSAQILESDCLGSVFPLTLTICVLLNTSSCA